MMTLYCLVEALLRNLVFLTHMFRRHLQRMASGSVVIYVEFPVQHWHFDPVLNASVLSACATTMVYVFHSCQFCSSVMSPFFSPHGLYEDISMNTVRAPFHSPMYPTDEEIDSNTRLTPTYSIKSDPSEPTYPSAIRLTLDFASLAASRTPTPRHGRGFIHAQVIP